MEITHRTNNLRIAPRKLRLVIDKFRNAPAESTLNSLPLIPNKGAYLFSKSLKSALQVAKDNDLDLKTLTIQQIWCDEGRKLKRSVSKSHGRVAMIIKHSSHLSIILKGEGKKKAAKPKSVANGEDK